MLALNENENKSINSNVTHAYSFYQPVGEASVLECFARILAGS